MQYTLVITMCAKFLLSNYRILMESQTQVCASGIPWGKIGRLRDSTDLASSVTLEYAAVYYGFCSANEFTMHSPSPGLTTSLKHTWAKINLWLLYFMQCSEHGTPFQTRYISKILEPKNYIEMILFHCLALNPSLISACTPSDAEVIAFTCGIYITTTMYRTYSWISTSIMTGKSDSLRLACFFTRRCFDTMPPAYCTGQQSKEAGIISSLINSVTNHWICDGFHSSEQAAIYTVYTVLTAAYSHPMWSYNLYITAITNYQRANNIVQFQRRLTGTLQDICNAGKGLANPWNNQGFHKQTKSTVSSKENQF